VGEIQKLDPTSRISVISEEPHKAYSKPIISHYLSGKITWDQLLESGKRLAPAGDNLEYLLDRTVTAIDPSNHLLEVASGDKIPYDRLMIATGARQKIPPILGLDPIRVQPFLTLNDAGILDRKIRSGKRALVIGGGLIGLEAADALTNRGMLVTVVEIMPWVMPTVLDRNAGQIVGANFVSHGVEIRTATMVNEITTNADGSGEAVISDGTKLPFALAILAAGVEPKPFVKEVPGLKVERGIVVDFDGRTSLDGIFAAGDVAEGPDPLREGLSLNLNWMSAREQGRVAGKAMANASERYHGSIMLNSLNLMGCPVITIGISVVPSKQSATTFTEIIDTTKKTGVYRKLTIRDGKVVGAILVGDITFSGSYHKYIREGIDIGDLGVEMLTGGRRFIQRLSELRREEMEGSYDWRHHVWEEAPYHKKMDTDEWKRRTGQTPS
jgi:NAD(P)H-nitrite reductase large subunit